MLNNCRLGNIPSALLLQIAGYLSLDLYQWVTLRAVCREWRATSTTAGWVAILQASATSSTLCHVTSLIPAVRKLRFFDANQLRLEPLSDLKSLQCLELSCPTLEGITGLDKLTNLTELRIISRSSGLPRHLLGLLALRGLRELDLQQCPIADDCLQTVATLQLSALKLPVTTTVLGLGHIAHMTSLELLHLQSVVVTEYTLGVLSQLTALKSLEFVGHRVTGFKPLQPFSLLQRLAVPFLNAPSLDFSEWPTLPTLSFLDLSYSLVSSLDFVSRLTNLKSLNLQSCGRLTDTGLCGICCLPLLETLNLHGCTSVTDVGLYALTEGEGLQSLRELDVTYCAVGDDSVAALSKLSRLELLNFNWENSRITARGIAHLKARTPARYYDWKL